MNFDSAFALRELDFSILFLQKFFFRSREKLCLLARLKVQSDSTAFPKLPKNVCLDDSDHQSSDGWRSKSIRFFYTFLQISQKVAYICTTKYTIVSSSSSAM